MPCSGAFLPINLKVTNSLFRSSQKSKPLELRIFHGSAGLGLMLLWHKISFLYKTLPVRDFEWQNINLQAMLTHAFFFSSHSVLKMKIFPSHCCRKQTPVSREFVMEAQFSLCAGLGFTGGAPESPGRSPNRVHSAWSGRRSGDCCPRLREETWVGLQACK